MVVAPCQRVGLSRGGGSLATSAVVLGLVRSNCRSAGWAANEPYRIRRPVTSMTASARCPVESDIGQRSLVGNVLADADAVVDPTQRRWCIPTPLAERAHECGDENAAYQGGIDEDRQSGAEPEELDEADVAGPEGEEANGQQRGKCGHDSPGASQPTGDRVAVGDAGIVQFLDPADDEQFVVHREPEGDAEQQYRHRGVGGSWGEAEEGREGPVLEDPHHCAEGCTEGECVTEQC